VRQFYVYILASHSRRLYIRVTNDLECRLYQHIRGWSSFTSRYKINRLVHYEVFDRPMAAICREKQLKHMLRREKIELIESANAGWLDLAAGWFEPLVD
jgi:putative endonuclease